ncbi:uncharacterized protein LOC144423019 [Styela clava]
MQKLKAMKRLRDTVLQKKTPMFYQSNLTQAIVAIAISTIPVRIKWIGEVLKKGVQVYGNHNSCKQLRWNIHIEILWHSSALETINQTDIGGLEIHFFLNYKDLLRLTRH